MLRKDSVEDAFDGLVLENSRVLAEFQKVQPRGERELKSRELPVTAQPPCRMHVAVHGAVRPVGLLDPQRDRLRDERFQLERVPQRDHVDCILEIAPQACLTHHDMRYQDVRPGRGIQFHNPCELA
ncbi:hypothetical protein WJ03_11100 [Burkholderia vietnamiensis]|nr:hypothetical protein WJ03_11100 [Burkholderia vietnamiensis]